VVGYILGAVMLVMGVLVIAGFFQFRGGAMGESSMLRNVFGLVLILYGIYRIAITESQRRREERSR
jgi:uncharacterized membrane protein HdeD (DUF308 family)